jgi:hypothetical protein
MNSALADEQVSEMIVNPKKPEPGQENQEKGQFELMAREARTGLLLDFWDFLRDNKKWWLLPIVITILLLGFFVLLSGTPAGSFLYTFF